MITINLWVVLTMVGTIVLGLWWMMRLSKTTEVDRWEQMQRSLPALKNFRGSDESPEFWSLIKETFYLPAWGAFTDDVVRHDLEVLSAIVEAGAKQLTQAELASLDAFELFLKKTQGKSKPDLLDKGLKKALQKIVDSKLDLAERKESRRTMVPEAAR